MRKIFIVISLVSLSYIGFSQQFPQFSLRTLDWLPINPAVAGFKQNAEIKLHIRSQWLGFKNTGLYKNDQKLNYTSAPTTQLISGHTAMGKNQNMGIGGFIMNDQTGPTSRLFINLDYSYIIPLQKVYLSMGLAATAMQYKIDGSKISVHEQGDKALAAAEKYNEWIPDASVGAMLYNQEFFFAVSAIQLLGQKATFYSQQDTSFYSKLEPHFYIIGGYDFPIGGKKSFKGETDYNLEPSFLYNFTKGNPAQIDLNVKLDYRREVFGGFSYRYKDAIALMLGLRMKKQFLLAYSYDIPTTKIRKYGGGSHEIVLSFDIVKSGSKSMYNVKKGYNRQLKKRLY